MRTLIVDDHQLFGAGLALLMDDLMPNQDIERVVDGSLAIQALQRKPADLVLLDWRLGTGLSGGPLIRQITEVCPGVRVVVVSGEGSSTVVHEAIEAGAVGFVPKESAPEVMSAALTLALNGGVSIPLSALANARQVPAYGAVGAHAPALRELPDVFPAMSERHREVLQRLARGMSNKAIGRELDITEGTVKQHVNAVFRELGVKSRTQAVYELASLGVRLN